MPIYPPVIAASQTAPPTSPSQVPLPLPLKPEMPILDQWLNTGLLNLIRLAPKNPVIRGKIRALYRIIPPKDMELTTEAWERFLQDSIPRMPQELRPVARKPNDPFINSFDQLVIPNANIVYNETGLANYSVRVTKTIPTLIIPAEVTSRGYDYVVDWVRGNAPGYDVPQIRDNNISYSSHSVRGHTITSVAGVTDWGAVALQFSRRNRNL